jgi:hypothetical protein
MLDGFIGSTITFAASSTITLQMSRISARTFFFNLHSGGWSPNWVHSARRPATYWPILPAPDDCEDGEFGGMNGRGNRSTRRKPAPSPLCPPQIPLNQTRDWTRAAAVGSQRWCGQCADLINALFSSQHGRTSWSFPISDKFSAICEHVSLFAYASLGQGTVVVPCWQPSINFHTSYIFSPPPQIDSQHVALPWCLWQAEWPCWRQEWWKASKLLNQ